MRRPRTSLIPPVCLLVLIGSLGCTRYEEIKPYPIPTNVPEALLPEQERTLGAILSKAGQTWFFKVSGPDSAVLEIRDELREFVERVEFDEEDQIVLDSLPEGWKQGTARQMRFATLDVMVENKQLNISVSRFAQQGDWDTWVKMNVNRWRGQVGLDESEDKWGEAETLNVANSDNPAVWVDLLGVAGASPAMTPPMMGSSSGGGMSGRDGMPGVGTGSASQGSEESGDASQGRSQPVDERITYTRPDGWRDGRMSSMRMAAFNVGPEDASAELTVIPAGGDLRGNVARWLGQVRSGEVPDSVVDQALADAQKIDVAGYASQRFYLTGEDVTAGTAIDATIVPLDDGISLFIKMTGPVDTVSSESDSVETFLKSLKLNF